MTQSHLIVTEEGLKIYKDDPSSAILCEDQERAMQLIVEHHFMSSGHLVPPAFDFPYPVPGIEFEVIEVNIKWPKPPSSPADIKTVARLIEHTAEKESALDTIPKESWEKFSQHYKGEPRVKSESPEIDKESQEDLLSEILENYQENEWCRKNNESYQNESDFIKSELEKFTIHRKP